MSVKVNVVPPSAALLQGWEELAERAAPNVFMHPATLIAAHAGGFADLSVLAATDSASSRLVGLWALQTKRVASIWPTFLSGPPYPYAFVSNPVVDAERVEEVTAALLEAISTHATLPHVLRLHHLDADCATYPALLQALQVRGQLLKLREYQRAAVSKEFGVKRSGSTRKKLRQDWNRLSAAGDVTVVNARGPDETRSAFEMFLSMEARSWKGERGTAILSNPRDAAFARQFISVLAQQAQASVGLLCVEGSPIAAQVLLYSTPVAYTWKTAFDAEYARYSPGALLVDKLTEQLLAGDIARIESCSPADSFMAHLWEGRRTTVELLADVRKKKSLHFAVAAAGERGYAELRGLRKRLRSATVAARSKLKRASAL